MAKSKKPADNFDPIVEDRIKEALERPVEDKAKLHLPPPIPPEDLPRWGIKPAPPRSRKRE